MVRQIHGRDFIERAENVVLIDGMGTGKIHLTATPMASVAMRNAARE
ncbi:ATP-binding protein [Novacetimonas pomaceti]